jgi:hypothetical protein
VCVGGGGVSREREKESRARRNQPEIKNDILQVEKSLHSPWT